MKPWDRFILPGLEDDDEGHAKKGAVWTVLYCTLQRDCFLFSIFVLDPMTRAQAPVLLSFQEEAPLTPSGYSISVSPSPLCPSDGASQTWGFGVLQCSITKLHSAA